MLDTFGLWAVLIARVEYRVEIKTSVSSIKASRGLPVQWRLAVKKINVPLFAGKLL